MKRWNIRWYTEFDDPGHYKWVVIEADTEEQACVKFFDEHLGGIIDKILEY